MLILGGFKTHSRLAARWTEAMDRPLPNDNVACYRTVIGAVQSTDTQLPFALTFRTRPAASARRMLWQARAGQDDPMISHTSTR